MGSVYRRAPVLAGLVVCCERIGSVSCVFGGDFIAFAVADFIAVFSCDFFDGEEALFIAIGLGAFFIAIGLGACFIFIAVFFGFGIGG